ncbi:MAG: hypothetical protein IVW53_13470 [Chloroflexi bacterium]|nr:hypothetical protein [Chloroflexota bacterium]
MRFRPWFLHRPSPRASWSTHRPDLRYRVAAAAGARHGRVWDPASEDVSLFHGMFRTAAEDPDGTWRDRPDGV